MITTGTTTTFTCSDGQTFTDQRAAEVHEAELKLKTVCDEHGYSAPSFSRDFLFDFLLEHAEDFASALAAVVAARRPTRSWCVFVGGATRTLMGTFEAVDGAGALEAFAQELAREEGVSIEHARELVTAGYIALPEEAPRG